METICIFTLGFVVCFLLFNSYYFLVKTLKLNKINYLILMLLFCWVFGWSFALGITVKSSLGDLEQPDSEWLVGKKGYIPVDGVPVRTVMTGQLTNADGSIVIDFDTGHIQGHFVLHERSETIGEAYDLMKNGQMNLFGVGIEDTQIEIKPLPDTVTE